MCKFLFKIFIEIFKISHTKIHCPVKTLFRDYSYFITISNHI